MRLIDLIFWAMLVASAVGFGVAMLACWLTGT
jgi:hypothetical protein